MSVGRVLSRVFGADAVACSHCGSTEFYPHPSLFGELGGVLGRLRYACCNCRRHTWRRPGTGISQPRPDELEVPSPPNAPTSLAALDIDAAPLPPAPTDLRALDEALALARRKRKRP